MVTTPGPTTTAAMAIIASAATFRCFFDGCHSVDAATTGGDFVGIPQEFDPGDLWSKSMPFAQEDGLPVCTEEEDDVGLLEHTQSDTTSTCDGVPDSDESAWMMNLLIAGVALDVLICFGFAAWVCVRARTRRQDEPAPAEVEETSGDGQRDNVEAVPTVSQASQDERETGAQDERETGAKDERETGQDECVSNGMGSSGSEEGGDLSRMSSKDSDGLVRCSKSMTEEECCAMLRKCLEEIQQKCKPSLPQNGDLVVLGGGVPTEFRNHTAVVSKTAENHCTVVVLDEALRFVIGECWPYYEDVTIAACNPGRLGTLVRINGLKGKTTGKYNGCSGKVVTHPRQGHPCFINKPKFPNCPVYVVCIDVDDPPDGEQKQVMLDLEYVSPL